MKVNLSPEQLNEVGIVNKFNRTINYQNYKEKRPQLNIMLRGLNNLQRDLVALHNNFIIKSPVLINTFVLENTRRECMEHYHNVP